MVNGILLMLLGLVCLAGFGLKWFNRGEVGIAWLAGGAVSMIVGWFTFMTGN